MTTSTYRSPARRRYRKAYNLRRLNGVPTSLVPADRARAHVRKLLDLGWSAEALEKWAKSQISSTTFGHLAEGHYQLCERATEKTALSIPLTVAPPTWMSDHTMVPILGAQRRVQALIRLGWPHRVLHDRYSAETQHLTRGTYSQMIAGRWREIDAMYRALCMTLGPSPISATRAARARWAPPLAWDDIDNPLEHPRTPTAERDVDTAVVDRILAGDIHLKANHLERAEVVRRWTESGRSLAELARATGWKPERYSLKEESTAA